MVGTCIEKRGWCEPGWEEEDCGNLYRKKWIVGIFKGRIGFWESIQCLSLSLFVLLVCSSCLFSGDDLI